MRFDKLDVDYDKFLTFMELNSVWPMGEVDKYMYLFSTEEPKSSMNIYDFENFYYYKRSEN